MANATGKRSIFAERIRVGRLTAGGVPDEGSENLFITGAVIKVEATPEIEAGEEYTAKDGNGDLCGFAKADDHIKNVSLAMSLCSLDAPLLEMLTGGAVLTDGGDIIGFDLPPASSSASPVSFEVWGKAWDSAQQATDEGDPQYVHYIFPWTTWVPDKWTVEAGFLSVDLKGNSYENSELGSGPGSDLPGTIYGAMAWFLDTNLPDADEDYQTLTLLGS